MAISKNEQITALALEIVEDVELSRTTTEALVLKASRLARLAGDEEAISWLWYERHGYVSDDEISVKYLGLTTRWIDRANDKAYFGSITVQEVLLATHEHELEVVKNFQPSGDYALLQSKDQQSRIIGVTSKMWPLQKIVSAVRAQVHLFASRIYSGKLFSSEAETIFEGYKQQVDARLSATAQGVFAKLPHAFERLSTGEAESISHALTTCRRIIDSFADAVFPPRTTSFHIGSQQIDVGQGHTRNRLRAFIYERIGQGARYERLNKNLTSLHDRVSAGVHADIVPDEARAIVLQTYLFLGELLSLPEQRSSDRLLDAILPIGIKSLTA
jgi:hypothetical protein